MASTSRPSAWRIDDAIWGENPPTGEGAARYGGRWNSKGMPVIYTGESLAMAVLEKYVSLIFPAPPGAAFIKLMFDFNACAIADVRRESLPIDWQAVPPSTATRAIGDDWFKSGRTAILRVPSALLPEESNYLVNPAHPDFPRITLHKPTAFHFPPRLLPGGRS